MPFIRPYTGRIEVVGRIPQRPLWRVPQASSLITVGALIDNMPQEGAYGGIAEA